MTENAIKWVITDKDGSLTAMEGPILPEHAKKMRLTSRFIGYGLVSGQNFPTLRGVGMGADILFNPLISENGGILSITENNFSSSETPFCIRKESRSLIKA